MSEQGNITGVVHFRLYNSIETESLELKISSEEHFWEEMDKCTARYVDKSLSIEQLFPIFVFQNSQVAAGDYSFPFQILTPATLPVSFYYYIQPTLEPHILDQRLYQLRQRQGQKGKNCSGTRRMTETIVGLQDSVSAQISTCAVYSKKW